MVPYVLLDVFTDRPFTGNPLAVFVDPGDLSDDAMQRLATELNLSESVFVWSPASPHEPWPTRIFTPRTELPFAGHPTVGAACALVLSGAIAATGPEVQLVLDEPAGPVPVAVTHVGSNAPRAQLTSPHVPAERETVPAGALAEVLTLTGDDLHASVDPSAWSAGVPFTVVPLRDLDALARARVDPAAWRQHLAAQVGNQLFVVTPLDADPAAATEWRARMFAPAMGIGEDPATGAAAAAFGGFLARLDPGGAASRSWTIHQGVEMGRPSRLDVTVHRAEDRGEVRRVDVAGSAVRVGEGSIEVPH